MSAGDRLAHIPPRGISVQLQEKQSYLRCTDHSVPNKAGNNTKSQRTLRMIISRSICEITVRFYRARTPPHAGTKRRRMRPFPTLLALITLRSQGTYTRIGC